LDDVIEKGKVIIRELARESFTRYRQLGLLILNSGYRKGQWRNAERERVMSEWDISQQTFSNLIRLGEMPELEFTNAVSKFRSLHDWANQRDPRIDVSSEDEDNLPEKDTIIYAKIGDIFLLGRHRLMCGDSTNTSHLSLLLNGKSPDALVTDPPYGINYVPFKNFGKLGKDYLAKYHNYPQVRGDNIRFDPSHLLELAKTLVLFGGNYYADKLPPSPAWLVWDKQGGQEWGDKFADCELIWTNLPFHAKIYRCTWKGMVREGESGSRYHPTQKPVKLLRDILLDTTAPSDLILDCYGGVGTTLLACEQVDRTCDMMEIEPVYCQIILTRWRQLTGQTPVEIRGT
jgi:DNA modification methylase